MPRFPAVHNQTDETTTSVPIFGSRLPCEVRSDLDRARTVREPQKRAQIIRDARDKLRTELTNALSLNSGMTAEESEFEHHSCVELARVALEGANQDSFGRPIEVIGRAMTTSDFPMILANVANRSLHEGFDGAAETWSEWCATGSVADFKPNTIASISAADSLDEIPENTEYKRGKFQDAAEEFQLATYGKLFAITRQALINDDLSALSDIPHAHGESAARKIGDLTYSVLTQNPIMGDGQTLFHSSHNNIGTGGVPSPTSLSEAIAGMGMQKDISGNKRLNIRPHFFIAPRALEGICEVMFRSEYFDATAKNSTTVNPYSGDYFTRIYDPRLDDNSEQSWYIAGPKGKTVKVFFLDGMEKPELTQQPGWSVDGIEFKVTLDMAAKAIDHRALYYNQGL